MDLIDIHAHIVPGEKDGARDLKEALAMAEAAIKDGVNLIVATPRVCLLKNFENNREEILKNVATFNQCLEYARIKLPVLPGAEYLLAPNLAERLRAGQLLTINDNGRYLLVELPQEGVPEYALQVFYMLVQQGVTPIISHPETNRDLVRDPELLQKLCARGVLSQVTSASLAGRMGRRAKKAALGFLENGTAQLIASDAQPSAGRMPVMYAAFEEVERRLGASIARTFTSDNPLQVIQGKPVKNISITPQDSLWQRFCKITEI